jgi:predicted nuclease of predicted toxin-antitoxin system
MLRFLVDTQLPPALASYIGAKGYDSIHTTSFKDGHLLQDKAISDIAIKENRIIVTKDHDFLERFAIHGSPPRVLLLQFGNISNPNLIGYFERETDRLMSLFLDGSSLVIFSRHQIVSY